MGFQNAIFNYTYQLRVIAVYKFEDQLSIIIKSKSVQSMQSCNLIYPRFSSCKFKILLNSICSQECLHFIFKCIYIAAVSKCQIIASLNPINCDPVCSIAIPPHSFKTSLSAYYILSRIFNPIINHITECKSHFAKTPPIISSIESVSLL